MLEWDISRVLWIRSGPIRRCSNIGNSWLDAPESRRNKGDKVKIGGLDPFFIRKPNLG